MAGEWDVQDTVPIDQFAPVIDVGGSKTAPAGDVGSQWAPVGASHPIAGPSGSLLTDVGRRAGTAGTEFLGATLGLPHAAAQGIDWLTSRLPGVPENTKVADFVGSLKQPTGEGPLFPDPTTAREMAYKTTGATEYVPATYAGRLGQAALNAAPFGVAGGLRAIPGAMGGGATSEMAGEWAQEHGWTPAQQFFARLVGGVPGQAAGNMASRMPVRPLWERIQDPEKAQLAQMATETYGIPLGVGNTTDNSFVRNLYSESGKMPLSGATGFRNQQQEAFTRAVTRTFGEDSSKVTPEVINAARDRLGGQFNTVASRTSIPMTDDFMTGLQGIVERAKDTMSADSIPAVERQAMNVVNTAANNGGNLGGQAYLDLTAKGGPLDGMMQSGNPGIRQTGVQLKSLIDDHLAAAADPKDVSMLQRARAQWKALMTVEPLTVRADAHGVATPSTGEISPQALRSAVNQSYSRVAQAAPGELPLADLARIGQHFLKGLSDSQTASREGAKHAIGAVPAALAAATVGDHYLGMPLAASAALGAGTLGAGAATNWMLRNPDTLRRMLPNPAISALIAAQPNQSAPFSFAPQETPQ